MYTQQKKKVNTFSSSDFSFKTVIKSNELYIKLKEIKFHPVRKTWRYIFRMSEHNNFSLPRCKSKSRKNAQFAIDV